MCNECYPGIQVVRWHEGSISKGCMCEKGVHHFSCFNNVDPGEKPNVLRVLNQVEEMLIAWVNLILKVSHAHGGQYKYSGHIKILPQDMSSIERKLPRWFEKLDLSIVRRRGVQSKYYECYVKRQHVLDGLVYKSPMNKYYKDVEIDMDSVVSLTERPTDVSSRLQFFYSDLDEVAREDVEMDSEVVDSMHCHQSSFLSHL